MLMEKWNRLICLSNSYLVQMLRKTDRENAEKAEAHLWKMNGIEMVALAVCYDVPILTKTEDVTGLSLEQHHFSLLKPDGKLNEALMNEILKIFESKKK